MELPAHQINATSHENRPKQQRSLPIPKEVNNFVIERYGSLYYHCTDCAEKSSILNRIESDLKDCGYSYITANEIERRLKNMKSHYRRKKSDLDLGLVLKVDWEYFNALDKIFSESEVVPITLPQEVIEETVQVSVQVEKRKSDSFDKPAEDVKPQDLSMKRRVIEFNEVSDLTSQIPQKPSPAAPVNDVEQANIDTVKKIIESIHLVDQQRLVLDQHRVALEIRRYELDVLGYQLSDLLYKLTHTTEN